ncbi:hypothetical protein BLJAPNOD_04133 [Ensifer sp. M14]|nr:hypothetical protein BLJAPNOD_04133 [Ensifer sp. M14]
MQSACVSTPGMGHASNMGRAVQCAPGGVAIAHQYAAVVTEEDLRINLAAAGLIIEQHDRLAAVFPAPVCPHEGCAGGFLVLFLQDLDRGLVTMDERLRPEPQLQGVIDSGEMPLARSDHPMAQSAATDGNAGTLEGLGQAVERRAIDIFVDEREGQRRGRCDAAGQRLHGHRREDNRRVDTGAVAMAAGIFEPHILQDLGLHLDMKLLGDSLTHAMHLMTTASAGLLVVG